MNRDDHLRGVLLVFAGIVVYSADALLIRMSDTGGFTAAFWRGLIAGLTLFVVFSVQYRGSMKRILTAGGIPMLVSGLLWALSGICFSLAVRLASTSVALVCLSTAPFFAALFSLLILKEKLSPLTLCCIAVSVAGIGYMYKDGIAPGTLAGNLAAMAAPVIIGLNFTNLHKHPSVSRVAVCMIGGFSGALISFAALRGNVLIPFSSLRYLLLLGAVVLPVGQLMVSLGTKYVPAPEVSLINSLETVLGIVYVWAFIGERPDRNCLIGGIAVTLAVALNSLVSLIRRRNRAGMRA
ncbi:DMT family transporter [Breznakiella homolactica]|uniref:EamA family transporter n=1 Tax=Breznakiella homolactica TaxID=2798577 RepID=A0A7T8B946_9SPIR|nr:DMT family transporter [Breznakiella homolactica]QQO09259.1 DMT family transporter [Breznakiella homolactica]